MQVAVIGAGAVGCYYGGLKGVEHRNVVREADINARFPRLLKTILGYPE
jgi:ketopantoate reductase